MNDESADHKSTEDVRREPTLVEKWLHDQQEWHKMAMEYFDSMVKNDDFLTHLGNAMRGSLLAGKPYPGTEPPDASDEASMQDDRIDEILHALHLLQGDIADLKMAVSDLKADLDASQPEPAATAGRQLNVPSQRRKDSRTLASESGLDDPG